MSSENKLSGYRAKLADPTIISTILGIVVIVTPAIITLHDYVILRSMTWEMRYEPGEPLRMTFTLGELFAFEYLIKYLFVIMVYRLYRNATSFRLTLLVGIVSESYLFIAANLGTILAVLLSSATGHFDIPLPIALITFLTLSRLFPYPKNELDPERDAWLISIHY